MKGIQAPRRMATTPFQFACVGVWLSTGEGHTLEQEEVLVDVYRPVGGDRVNARSAPAGPRRGWAAGAIKWIPTAISLATHLAELLRHGGLAS